MEMLRKCGLVPSVSVSVFLCSVCVSLDICHVSSTYSVTEVFINHAKEHFCNMDKVRLAPLHLAAGHGHTQLCSLLAAEVYTFILS